MDDPKNLFIHFTAKTLDYVINVLAQRPFAEVQSILNDIGQQVNAQQQAQQNPHVVQDVPTVTHDGPH